MSKRSITLDDRLYQYLLDHSLRESNTLKALREETADLPLARMQIAPEQGQFMALLVQLTHAKRIIEVGVFTGYSTLCMAQSMPADGCIVACDISEEWTQIAQRYWDIAKVSDRIDLRLAPALDTLKGLVKAEAMPFDLAFIDAHKPEYEAYYEACLKLLRPGGLIIVDNVLWGGSVLEEQSLDEDTCAIKLFNKKIAGDSRVDISMIPVGDGLTLAKKR